MANDEQNYLAKYIKEFKNKTKLKNNSNLKKVKEDVINNAMAFFKGRETVLKAFESGISSRLEKSEQSEQSNDDIKYNEFGYDTHKSSRKIKRYFIEKYFK